jgi:REP element-mobilizing transposase RayT
MAEYRRAYVPGATWFLTVTLAERESDHGWVAHSDDVRQAFRWVMAKHPFRLDAVVVLPDPLHRIWTLPRGDSDFSTCWNLLTCVEVNHSNDALRSSAHPTRAVVPAWRQLNLSVQHQDSGNQVIVAR